MGKRRAGRELALKMLFQIDVAKRPLEEVLQVTREQFNGPQNTWDFAEQLVRAVIEHQKDIDETITKFASGWTLDRMASVDRNLLRIALCEMLYLEDIPYSVSINEAVELAKVYSTGESGKFVNGILGNFARESGFVRDTRPGAEPIED